MSCDFISSTKELNRFYEAKVVIPANLEIYYNGNDTSASIIDDIDNKLIVYYNSTDCSACEVSYINRWDRYIEYNKWTKGKFGVVFVFSPSAKEYPEIKRMVNRLDGIGTPILLDKTGEFDRLNPTIPNARKYHTFMIDKNGSVVVVGSPIGNEKLWESYQKEISRLCK